MLSIDHQEHFLLAKNSILKTRPLENLHDQKILSFLIFLVTLSFLYCLAGVVFKVMSEDAQLIL